MEPFISQIQAFGFNFNPRGWAKCEGQILPINQNQALYSLLGTTFGGDGRTSFALPDLRGRGPIGFGNGAQTGLQNYKLGQKGGQERVTLSTAQIPAHEHTLSGTASLACSNQPGDEDNPAGNYPAAHEDDEDFSTTPNGVMKPAPISGAPANVGGGQSHENRQPYIAINWCIALQGLFPSRN